MLRPEGPFTARLRDLLSTLESAALLGVAAERRELGEEARRPQHRVAALPLVRRHDDGAPVVGVERAEQRERAFPRAALATVLMLVSSIPAAYALSRLQWKGRNAALVIVLMMMMLPPQVTQVPIYVMWTNLHLTGTLWPLILPNLLLATDLRAAFHAAAAGPVLNWMGRPGAWAAERALLLFGPVSVLFLPMLYVFARKLWRFAEEDDGAAPLHQRWWRPVGVLLFAMALMATPLSLVFTGRAGTLPAGMGGLAGLLSAKAVTALTALLPESARFWSLTTYFETNFAGVFVHLVDWADAQAAGVPMVLANARLSERSAAKGHRLAALLKPAAQVWRDVEVRRGRMARGAIRAAARVARHATARTVRAPGFGPLMRVPALRTHDFLLASVSDAV